MVPIRGIHSATGIGRTAGKALSPEKIAEGGTTAPPSASLHVPSIDEFDVPRRQPEIRIGSWCGGKKNKVLLRVSQVRPKERPATLWQAERVGTKREGIGGTCRRRNSPCPT